MNPRQLIIVIALLSGAAVAQTGSGPTTPSAEPSKSSASPAAKRPAEPFYSQSLNADAQPAKPAVKRSAPRSKSASAAKPSGAKANVTAQATTPSVKPFAGKAAATPASTT